MRIDRGLRGFRGADVFRGEEDVAVAFVTLTRFDSLDAIRAFAGDTYERPVLEPTAISSTTPVFSRPQLVEVGIGPVILRGYSNRRHAMWLALACGHGRIANRLAAVAHALRSPTRRHPSRSTIPISATRLRVEYVGVNRSPSPGELRGP